MDACSFHAAVQHFFKGLPDIHEIYATVVEEGLTGA